MIKPHKCKNKITMVWDPRNKSGLNWLTWKGPINTKIKVTMVWDRSNKSDLNWVTWKSPINTKRKSRSLEQRGLNWVTWKSPINTKTKSRWSEIPWTKLALIGWPEKPNKYKKKITMVWDPPNKSGLNWVTQVRAIICCLLIVHHRDWKLHASTATHPYLQFFVESTTTLVGHIVVIYFVDHHKNINLKGHVRRLTKLTRNSCSVQSGVP